jgi:hypothetical protein
LLGVSEASRESLTAIEKKSYKFLRHVVVPAQLRSRQCTLPILLPWIRLVVKLLDRYTITADRSQPGGLRPYKFDISNAIQDMQESSNESARKSEIDLVVSLLALYERKELLSLLQMVLWKMKMGEWKLLISPHLLYFELTGDYRRIYSGDVINISNALPFLGFVPVTGI